jgi:tRNA A-37 threonylcarbamoyl transferase component Bud32
LLSSLEIALKSHSSLAGSQFAAWRRITSGTHAWLIRTDVPADELIPAFADTLVHPTGFLKKPDARSSSTVFRVSNFVAKRYGALKLRDRAKCIFRGAPARRALNWTETLAGLSVPTIKPVAVVVCRWRPWESYLISEYIKDHSSIQEWANESSLQRRWLPTALARIMALLHNAGIAHGDAHLANFLVDRSQRCALVLVDVDGLRRQQISLRVAAKNLKRLLDYSPGTNREHLRFLVAYAQTRTPQINSRELLRQMKRQHRGPGPLRRAEADH